MFAQEMETKVKQVHSPERNVGFVDVYSFFLLFIFYVF